jgi:hypothetical protein
MEDTHSDPRPSDSQDPNPQDSGPDADAREHARKERVLHTRISEQLAEDIRRVAEDLRVPVSNLVRNVLEETFSVVESVTENVGRWVEEVTEEVERARGRSARGAWRRHHRHGRWARRFARDDAEAPAPPHAPPPPAAPVSGRPDFAAVLGWQPLVMNRAEDCADCRRSLVRGDRAFLGLTQSGVSGTVLCRACMEARE